MPNAATTDFRDSGFQAKRGSMSLVLLNDLAEELTGTEQPWEFCTLDGEEAVVARRDRRWFSAARDAHRSKRRTYSCGYEEAIWDVTGGLPRQELLSFDDEGEMDFRFPGDTAFFALEFPKEEEKRYFYSSFFPKLMAWTVRENVKWKVNEVGLCYIFTKSAVVAEGMPPRAADLLAGTTLGRRRAELKDALSVEELLGDGVD
jgi:hypothetical protein